MVAITYRLTFPSDNYQCSIDVVSQTKWGTSDGIIDTGERRSPIYRFQIADLIRAARRRGTVSKEVHQL